MFRALLLTAAGGLAVAAPVPKAAPAPAPQASAALTLGTAVLDGERLKFSYFVPATGGDLALATSVGPRPARTATTVVQLSSVKVTTADGKELTGDDLARRLGESPAVARSASPLDPEWKKVFADDVLFVEPSGKPAGGVARPLPAVIRPGVIRPAVLPPVEEPPVEKKEEKKEEKK